MQIRGTNVLLTGASRGLGVHIARALASRGAHLALVARSASALDEVAAQLAQQGVRVAPLAADLAHFDGHEALIQRAEAALGSVDVLINNAGIEGNALYADFTPASIEEMIRVDLLAPMLLTRAVLPRLLAAGRGHVVNIASLAGKSGTAYDVPYAAAKGGLISFSHSLRAELAELGKREIGVSAVCPGFISDTGMYAEKARVVAAPLSPVIGSSTPDQVAAAVVRAIESNRAELLVNPGPVRLLAALGQFFPDFPPAIAKRFGINEIFRQSGEHDARQRARGQV